MRGAMARHVGRLAAVSAAVAALALADAPAGPTVTVTGGRIQGVVEDGVAVYRGIPFAAPPVGPRRWKPPQHVIPWNGVKPAMAFGPACLQGGRTPANDQVQSEDCLTLNVWTPAASPADRLPVMVWIHGGAFTQGSARAPLYSGASFAGQGVVFVSIQYRLGRFGFFAHPAISAEDPNLLRGNYGIMDQVAALEWVRDNIQVFGGDARNVTIFGESAGGISVNALMATPAANGLFEKAISESGFGHTVGITLETAEARGAAFARAHGITGTGLAAAAALRALPADAVLTPPAPASGGGGDAAALPYPIVDGRLLLDQIARTFAHGDQANVPYLAGGNSDEASLFPQARNRPQAVFDRTGDAARARALYVTGNRDEGLAALDLVTDMQVTEPVRYLGRLMARIGQRAYGYYFSYLPPDRRAGAPGVPHGGELRYVFGRLRPADPPEAKTISRDISAAWVAFARTGSPTIPGGPDWEPIGVSNYAFMEFGTDGPQLRPAFEEDKLDFVSAVMNEP